jgi:hypothetical protein
MDVRQYCQNRVGQANMWGEIARRSFNIIAQQTEQVRASVSYQDLAILPEGEVVFPDASCSVCLDDI